MITKVAIKFFCSSGPEKVADAINIFHSWIQNETVPGMLIDVADYAHVPDGPGIMLIGHEADHQLDLAEGPAGYLYSRKRLLEGSDSERLLEVAKAAAHAASVFEADERSGVTLATNQVRVIFNDRLNTPNTDDGFAAVSDALEALARAVFDGDAMIERDTSDPRGRLTVTLAADSTLSIADLAKRLEAAPAGA